MFITRTSRLFAVASIFGIVASMVVATADRVISTCRAVSNLVADVVLGALRHVADSFTVEQPKVKGEQLVELIQFRDYLARQVKRERIRKEAGWCMAPST